MYNCRSKSKKPAFAGGLPAQGYEMMDIRKRRCEKGLLFKNYRLY